MYKYKTISAVLAAALIAAAAAVFSTGFTKEVEASTPVAAAKGDRLDIGPVGAACTQQAWPYYEAKCLRDKSKNAGRAQAVRIVTADRLPLSR
jgi:hypothetical protein